MKDGNRLYHRWLDHRRQLPAPTNFTRQVMTAIERDASLQEEVHPKGLQSYMNQTWFRWITASGLVMLGLLRILYIAGCLFRTSLVMP